MPFIKLTRGQIAIVDEEDYERLSKLRWCANKDNWTGKFSARRTTKKLVTMQEMILGKKEGFQIDHINLDRLDNRRSNLRHVTKQQNLYNKGVYKNNTLGFKGIFRNNTGRFTVRLNVEGKRHSIGTYKTLIEAAHAYNRGAMQHYGEFARLNLIESEG